MKWPSFLHGLHTKTHQESHAEGSRCGEQYRRDGSFPSPLQLMTVQNNALVLTQEVSDFQRDRPVWRLHMLSTLKNSLYDAFDDLKLAAVRDAFEFAFRDTPWGALYFAIAQMSPTSAQCTAPRLQAVVRFWEPLASARYLFKRLGEALTLDELMEKSCGWGPSAWCPESQGPMRERMALAAERMTRATREDSLEAILRQLPRALPLGRDLMHRATLADPSFQRERLATLNPQDFERISGACTSDLLGQLYAWDRELGRH